MTAPVSPTPCPRLGMVNDPDTHYAFASPDNRCFVLPSPGEISPSYQIVYCLTGLHAGCPIFAGREQSPPLPIGVVAAPTGAEGRRPQGRWLVSLIAGSALVGIVAAALLAVNSVTRPTGIPDATDVPAIAMELPPSPTAAATATLRPTIAPTGTPAAPGVPTATRPPPATETYTAAPQADVPIGPLHLFVYTIAEGDTLGSIAIAYGTTVKVLMLANGLTGESLLRIGQPLIVPAGHASEQDVSRFLLYRPESDQPIEAIAERFGAAVDAIRRVNDLGAGPTVPAGRLLFVPAPPLPTPTPAAETIVP